MSRTKQWVLILAGVLFLIISTYLAQAYITAQQAGTTPQYFSAPTNSKTGLGLIVLVIVMFAGIIGSHLFETTKKTSSGESVNVRDELSRMVSSPKFIMALIVSPLIFNSVYLVIGDNPASIGGYLLAFQNGFFWESIINGMAKAPENVSSDSVSPQQRPASQ